MLVRVRRSVRAVASEAQQTEVDGMLIERAKSGEESDWREGPLAVGRRRQINASVVLRCKLVELGPLVSRRCRRSVVQRVQEPVRRLDELTRDAGVVHGVP